MEDLGTNVVAGTVFNSFSKQARFEIIIRSSSGTGIGDSNLCCQKGMVLRQCFKRSLEDPHRKWKRPHNLPSSVELHSSHAAATWLSKHQCDSFPLLLFADSKSSHLPSQCQQHQESCWTQSSTFPIPGWAAGTPCPGAGVHKTIGARHKFPSTGRMTNISFVELAITDTKYPSTSQRNPGFFFPGPVAWVKGLELGPLSFSPGSRTGAASNPEHLQSTDFHK